MRWRSQELTLVPAEGLPCGVTERADFLSPSLPRPAIWHAWDEERLHVEGCADQPVEPGFFLRLQDSVVLPEFGIVATGPASFLRESTVAATWLDPGFRTIPGAVNGGDAPRIVPPKPSRVVEGRHLLLGHWGANNYHHWFVDCIAGVVEFLPELQSGELGVLTRPLLPWQRRTLELLELHPSRVTEVSEDVVLCRDLVFSSLLGLPHHRRVHPSKWGVAEGRLLHPSLEPATRTPGHDPHVGSASTLVRRGLQTVQSAVPHRGGSAPPFIYLRRREGQLARTMGNEESLAASLEGIGFTTVVPGDLTIDEQVQAFRDTRVIVSAHGAGLTNMGFAPSGCVVVEIIPPGRSGAYVYLAAVMGHQYTYVLADVDESSRKTININGKDRPNLIFEYTAPIERVLRTVEEVLADDRSRSAR